MMSNRLNYSFMLLILSLSFGVRISAAQGPFPREFELKAAWLYQFGNQMIDWPGESEEPFVIGVYGSYPGDLHEQLNKIPDRNLMARGRRVVIRQYRRTDDLTAENTPDILFISRNGPNERTLQDRVNRATELSRDHHVLLVGDQNNIQNEVPISFRVDVQQRKLMLHLNERSLPEDVQLKNRDLWNRLSNVTIVRAPTDSDTNDP